MKYSLALFAMALFSATASQMEAGCQSTQTARSSNRVSSIDQQQSSSSHMGVLPPVSQPPQPNLYWQKDPLCKSWKELTCVECSDKSYFSNGVCTASNPLCATFNASSCTSCYPGYKLSAGSCVVDPDFKGIDNVVHRDDDHKHQSQVRTAKVNSQTVEHSDNSVHKTSETLSVTGHSVVKINPHHKSSHKVSNSDDHNHSSTSQASHISTGNSSTGSSHHHHSTKNPNSNTHIQTMTGNESSHSNDTSSSGHSTENLTNHHHHTGSKVTHSTQTSKATTQNSSTGDSHLKQSSTKSLSNKSSTDHHHHHHHHSSNKVQNTHDADITTAHSTAATTSTESNLHTDCDHHDD